MLMTLMQVVSSGFIWQLLTSTTARGTVLSSAAICQFQSLMNCSLLRVAEQSSITYPSCFRCVCLFLTICKILTTVNIYLCCVQLYYFFFFWCFVIMNTKPSYRVSWYMMQPFIGKVVVKEETEAAHPKLWACKRTLKYLTACVC